MKYDEHQFEKDICIIDGFLGVSIQHGFYTIRKISLGDLVYSRIPTDLILGGKLTNRKFVLRGQEIDDPINNTEICEIILNKVIYCEENFIHVS